MWDISVAGHVSAGEDPVASGLRELEEEIGLKVKQEDLQFFKIKKVEAIYKDIKNSEFYYVYFLKFDGDIENLKLQTEEVEEIKLLLVSKLEEELKMNPDKYVPHGDYWFEAIDEVKRKLAGD